MPISNTLKQKLSSLSLSQSAASSSTSLPSPSSFASNSSRRNNVFNFARRERTEYSDDEPVPMIDDASLDEIMQRVIRQAGVDYEVVITAAEFPDPRVLSYDLLFQRVLRYLDLFVESDYSVVFLVAGGKFAPGWSWVWKSYRSLNRKYRKNLKKLYIVHTTLFSKMLFSLAGTIISPKFFRKIQYIPTLSALAQCVPLTNLDLHPAVYRENLKHEREIVIHHNEPSQMFGVSLDQLMGPDGLSSGIPRAVKDCAEDIRARGLEVEGLFRRSPSSTMLKHAGEAYNRGHPVSLSYFDDPNISAVLLKKFFRDLPQPIFSESMYPLIQACPLPTTDASDRSCVDYIRNTIIPMVDSTSPPALIVLSYVIHLLHDVSLRSSINKMDATNLALVFTPNLVAGSNIIRDTQMASIPTVAMQTASLVNPSGPLSGGRAKMMTLGIMMKVCIEQYFEIFEEIPDRTTASSSHPSLSLSSGPNNGLIPPNSTYSQTFSARNDSDDEDEAVLVMPLGPSSPTTSSSSHHGTWSGAASPMVGSAASSPPGAPRAFGGGMDGGYPASPLASPSPTHRRKDSVQSQATTRNSSSTTRGAESIHGSVRGTLRAARSVISIDRTPGKSGSIRLGSDGSPAGRRVSGAGVEAIGVTAAGFFSPVNKDSPSASGS
ncbi:Rho GTPase activation protein [Clavulina sp. PMI_390]|nr:Rho GTPase activation protein [Clavulina sp. PMI_390]